jgi:hypothetical protein
MYAEHQRRLQAGYTMDQYPASHSDLVYCALALIDAKIIPRWDDFQEIANLALRGKLPDY